MTAGKTHCLLGTSACELRMCMIQLGTFPIVVRRYNVYLLICYDNLLALPLACFKATVTIQWRARMIICSILILFGTGVTVQSQCELLILVTGVCNDGYDQCSLADQICAKFHMHT